MSDEVFTIPARRCKRCGGLLTSAQGIRDGYGPCCLRKMRQEEAERRMNENQCSLFDMETEPPETEKSPLNGACATGLSPSGHCGAAAYCQEPYDCCAACSKDCNLRCGWLKTGKENSNEPT